MPRPIIIYYLGLLIAVPAAMALAMHASNKPGAQSRMVNVACALAGALMWPIFAPIAIVGNLLILLRCGRVVDRFIDWVASAGGKRGDDA